MSRSVSSTFLQAAYAQQTDQVFLVTLRISHASLAQDICVVNNYENIASNGAVYYGYPFEINLPTDTDESIPQVSLTISNVDRVIVDAVRTLTGPANIAIAVILASSPNTIEAGPFNMKLRSVSYDSFTVTGTISADDILNEPFPADGFTPKNFPGLF